jgi:hypothetical protein
MAGITENANIPKVHIRIQTESWNMCYPLTKNWSFVRTYFALLPVFEKHRMANIQNDTLRCEKANLMKIPKQVQFWTLAFSVRNCWHYLCNNFMSKGIDINQWVHNVSKYVDSSSAYLTVKITQSGVCLYRVPLESLSKSKIMKLLVFSQT